VKHFIPLALALCCISFAQTEDDYNRAFCNLLGGVAELRLPSAQRIDCETAFYSIEADWASGTKHYEAIGQALSYSRQTGKIMGIMLIVKDEKGCSRVDEVWRIMHTLAIPFRIWTTGHDCDDVPILTEVLP